MVSFMKQAFLLGLVFWLAVAAGCLADEPASEPTATWKTDTLTLTDGRVLEGWIQSESSQKISFRQIVRKPGKPLYLRGLTIPTDSIQQLTRLGEQERELLQEQVERYRERREREEKEKQQVQLQRAQRFGGPMWHYRGAWFELFSNAAEDTVRTLIVRLEQRWAAFRQILPPKMRPRQPPTVIVWGAQKEYRDFLRIEKLDLAATAIYDAANGRIIAYSELGAVAEELERIAAEHRHRLAELEEERTRLKELQQAEYDTLRQRGATRREIVLYQRLREKHYQEEQIRVERAIEAAERHNRRRLGELVDQTFRTMYHEAFHAYFERFVFDEEHNHVPHWLHEGLAQVLESAPVEGGAIRLTGSPDRYERAEQLHNHLAGPEAISLEDLLLAPEKVFLPAEDNAEEMAKLHYLYAWGLADYLALERKLFSQPALIRYVSRSVDQTLNPLERFSKFVDEPLDEFERKWKAYLHQLTHRRD